MQKKLQKAILATGALIASHSALALDYHGYFRANTGSNSASGGQTCFGLAGAGSKYRLGNECGVYGELMLGQEVVKTDDGASFKANVMFNIINGQASSASLSKGSGEIGLPQVYLSAEKVPELGGATAWMGRRYYKREDLHITDFFYWNPSGVGAGLEDLPVGNAGMKFSYALLREDNTTTPLALNTGDSSTRHDFQLRGLNVNPGGSLEFGLALIAKDSNLANRKGGSMLTVQHRQSNVFGNGENKFAVQYGTGAGVANGGTGDTTNGSDVHRFRIVEGLYSQLTNKLGGQLVAVYQKDTANDITKASKWTTFGGRVAYGLTQHIKLLADLGRDNVTPGNGGPSRNLTKFTIAAALAAGPGYYSRPELRLFYTNASWNDAARNAASAGDPLSLSGVFGNAKHGSVIGLSAESWW
ncbi:MAG: carbohydrate porin [Betaproteobacteria bacterium]|nr:carbohydrate porin [Betaproteobacteria bacterium]